ncbi:hypothetical protein [Streptomyces sp. NPDC005953]|uniref:hypothetical protein n=1 Tax=Streptomyces sp. NPDC005953 TaxID=3156719 RepID=UPI0033EC1349
MSVLPKGDVTGFRPEQVVGEATHTVLSPTTPAIGPVPKQINGSKRHVAVNTRSLAGGIQLLEQIQQLLAERILVRPGDAGRRACRSPCGPGR